MRSSMWIRNQLDVTFVLSFISPLQVAQHVSDNHVPIFRSWRLRSVIATCWYCAVTVSGIIQICLSVWVDMFYICLVCVKSRVSGLCVVIWGVVGGGRFNTNQTNIEHIDPHRHIWIIPLTVTAQNQHVPITLRSRQLLKMGTWLSETCWATCEGEIKDKTKVTSSWFLIHIELRCTVNHTSEIFDLLGCYAAQVGSYLPTFRNNLSVPSVT